MKTKSLFDAEGALEAPSAELLDVILNAPYVAVDVETETTAPKGITLKDYGLSYLAPVRMVCVAARGQARAMVAKEVGLDFTHLMSIKRVRSNVDLHPCFVSEDIAKAGR